MNTAIRGLSLFVVSLSLVAGCAARTSGLPATFESDPVSTYHGACGSAWGASPCRRAAGLPDQTTPHTVADLTSHRRTVAR